MNLSKYSIVHIGLGTLVILLCIVYIQSDYTQLISFYTNLGCFYGMESWQKSLFTPDAKFQANVFCVLACFVTIGCLTIHWKLDFNGSNSISWFKQKIKLPLTWKNLVVSSLLGVVLFYWQNQFLKVSFDEVFSAVHFASIHPFQTISYYPFPNNHILFNFLNNSIISISGLDSIWTGKIISLLFFILFLMGNAMWLSTLYTKRIFRYTFLFVLATTFAVLGFSGQGRGYSMLLYFEWMSLYSTLNFIQTKEKKYLRYLLISLVLGTWTLPSFIMWEFGLCAIILVHLLSQKVQLFEYVKTVFLANCLSFICYLPVLCFSGLDIIIHNDFVKPIPKSLMDFLYTDFSINLNTIFNCWLSGLPNIVGWGLLLLLLPIGIYTFRNITFRKFLVKTLIMGVTMMFFIVLIRRFPFYRNLTGYGYLLVFIVLSSCFGLIRKYENKWAYIALIVSSIAIGTWQLHYFKKNASQILYYYDINATYNTLYPETERIPTNASVFISDNSFYWAYLLNDSDKKRSLSYQSCKFDFQDYCIIADNDKVSDWDSTFYSRISRVNEYSLFKRLK